jgi:hypothetical protein
MSKAKEEFDLHVICGPELEFYNYAETTDSVNEKNFQSLKPLTPGMFGYSLLRTGQNSTYFQALFDESAKFDVHVEGLHCETGPGVLEVAIACTDAVTAADSATLFKYSSKIIGSRMGIMPCFMAKVIIISRSDFSYSFTFSSKIHKGVFLSFGFILFALVCLDLVWIWMCDVCSLIGIYLERADIFINRVLIMPLARTCFMMLRINTK